MRPRGWASFWTILAAIAGVVGAAQPSIRCSTQMHNSHMGVPLRPPMSHL